MAVEKYFMINVHGSMGLGQDRTHDPWISNHIRCQLHYGARLETGFSEVTHNRLFEYETHLFLDLPSSFCDD